KTVIAAETLLVRIFQRAKLLTRNGTDLFASPALGFFLKNEFSKRSFLEDPHKLRLFNELDDSDLATSIKTWCHHEDKILSELCRMLINRRLPHIEIQSQPFDKSMVEKIKRKVAAQKKINKEDADHFVYTDSVKNKAYSIEGFKINVLFKTGKTKDIALASDQLNITALSHTVVKYFLCYPKNV
ncbi:MAG: phosphohydrolase, partial [Bacteroidia bacterium]